MGILMALFIKGNDVQRRSGSVRYGTSELSYAGSEECRTASVGESERFPAESIYSDLLCNDHHLVPADL